MRAGARQVAKAAGLTRYFTGAPCLHGHIAERSVASKACVECTRIRRETPEQREKARAWFKSHYAENRESELVRGRLKEAKPQTKELRKQRRLKNAESLREQSNAWRANNIEKAREYLRKHYENNKGYYRARDRLRRAMLADCGGKHSHSDIETLMAKQCGQCRYCKADLELGFHVDHRMPLALGGSNDPSNLQLLCPRCNRSKGAKHPDIYERSLGLTLTTID